MRTCPSCHRILGSETVFCGSCGASLNSSGYSSSALQGDGFDFDFNGSQQSYAQPNTGWGANSWSQPSTSSWASNAYSGSLVPRWKRLVGYILDAVLALVTFGIGWWIWFFIIAGRGQTPAKQILKTRVVHPFNPSSTWIITVARYFILSLPAWLVALVDVFNLISLPYSMLILSNIIHVTVWLLPLIDAAFIFSPRQQRVVDMLFKTQVVHA